jgi:predicted glutamine amidotransferase
MLAHIRYATQGEVSLENVHPFSRVWKGVQMTFCHNGDCPTFNNTHYGEPPLLGKTTRKDIIYHPVGDTDSEAVFCAILNALTVEFPDGLPTLPVLHEFLSILCAEIVEQQPESTIFNFLLGCSQYTLFAYSWPGKRPGSKVWNGLYYLVRQPPFSTAKLLDADYEIDFRRVTTPADRVAVITTKPLTEEPGWTEFKRGELLMFDKGLPYRTPKCCEAVEKEGRGLFSKAVTAKCSRSPAASRILDQISRNAESPPALTLAPPACCPPELVIAAPLVLRLSEHTSELYAKRKVASSDVVVGTCSWSAGIVNGTSGATVISIDVHDAILEKKHCNDSREHLSLS